MNLTILSYIGITILLLDIIWILFYYYYGTVKVYNFIEEGKYQYLGFLWIRKKQGDWFLKIPKEMIENSVTTEYKLVSQSGFHTLRKGEKMYVSFRDKYVIKVRVFKEITVKNYIATSHQL